MQRLDKGYFLAFCLSEGGMANEIHLMALLHALVPAYPYRDGIKTLTACGGGTMPFIFPGSPW